MQKKTLLLLHGLGGSKTQNWFPWLKKSLEDRGHYVVVPNLPDTLLPSSKQWINKVLSLNIDLTNTIIIGHSLGGTLIYILSQEKSITLNNCYMIASPINDLGWEDLKPFFKGMNLEKIPNIKNCQLIYSDNDPYVPIQHGQNYHSLIKNSHLIEFQCKGHFNGFNEFPELLKLLSLSI